MITDTNLQAQAAVVTSADKPGAQTFFDKKFLTSLLPPAFITVIVLAGQISFGVLDSYVNILTAIGVSMVTDLVLGKVLLGKWKNLSSAYISGNSIGILIRSNMLWPYIVVALLSIMSKYVLRYKGRHLWNPSNFGVSWMLYVAPLAVAGLSIQWGNNFLPLAIIWALGLYIVTKAKRAHVTITYVVSFVALAYLRSFITGDTFLSEVSPITGPMYQLFIFFMITDPPTSVSSKRGQILVAFLVALVEFFLRLDSFIYAPFYALFLVGPAAKFIDLRMQSRRAARQPAV